MVSTGGPLTVDGTGWEVWLQVVVMSRGRRRPCYLGEMDGGFYNGPGPRMFEIRAAIGDGGTPIEDVQEPQQCAEPSQSEDGWTDSETPHWLGGTRPPPRCYPGRVSTLGWFLRCAQCSGLQ